jgi:DNA-binding MarR family transcriptional regulator
METKTERDTLEFLRLLWAVDHQLQAASKRLHARIGVTSPQRFVIRMLARNPGLGAGHLAEMLHDHPSTLTGVLQRLEEREVIRRTVHPTDARRACLELTEKGRAIDQLREGTVESIVARALSRVSPEDVEAARRALIAIASELRAEFSRGEGQG